MNELEDKLFQYYDALRNNVDSIKTARNIQELESLYKNAIYNLNQLVEAKKTLLLS